MGQKPKCHAIQSDASFRHAGESKFCMECRAKIPQMADFCSVEGKTELVNYAYTFGFIETHAINAIAIRNSILDSTSTFAKDEA